jgi:polysaccharide biosynthesis/export protein
VPRQTQEVTVIGEVQNATSHLFEPSLSRDDYLDRSGGLTQRADEKRLFIVRANGSVAGTGGEGWFRRNGGNAAIRPGDTVVVPLDAERMRPLSMWQAVTQIVYNLAIAAAAVNSF